APGRRAARGAVQETGYGGGAVLRAPGGASRAHREVGRRRRTPGPGPESAALARWRTGVVRARRRGARVEGEIGVGWRIPWRWCETDPREVGPAGRRVGVER